MFAYFLSTLPRQLLEDHLKSLHTESLEEELEYGQGWDNWLVESDSSSSDESNWINVESDESKNLEIRDSDDEATNGEFDFTRSDRHDEPSTRVSSLATTKVMNAPASRMKCRLMSVRYLRQQILP